ncbi:MAG TPA: hypothetical protein VHB01_04445 [Nitrosospira sp.]|nr:hypothetical protein [Nitrosospira sp.]
MASIPDGYDILREFTEKQLSKGIRKLEKQIALHEKWIADLFSKVQNSNDLDPRSGRD